MLLTALFVYIILVYFCMFIALDFCIDITYANAICFHALCLGYSHIVCLSQLFYIIYSAFNHLVLFILCSHSLCS